MSAVDRFAVVALALAVASRMAEALFFPLPPALRATAMTSLFCCASAALIEAQVGLPAASVAIDVEVVVGALEELEEHAASVQPANSAVAASAMRLMGPPGLVGLPLLCIVPTGGRERGAPR